MNKIISILFAVCLFVPSFAQEGYDNGGYSTESQPVEQKQEKERRVYRDIHYGGQQTSEYSDWYPKAGDWNVMVGMNPMAIVMGGTWSRIGGFSAGYMLTDKMGLKLSLGLDISIWNNRGYARDDAAFASNPLSMQKVTDKRKDTRTGGTVSIGADWHIGSSGKVQGVFGAGIMYGFNMNKQEFTYGNVITEINQVPTITDALDRDGNRIVPAYNTFNPIAGSDIINGRILKRYNDATNPLQMVGVYGSAGIEWFVTPKLALGLNATLNIMYEFMNAYTTTFEGWSNQQSKLIEWTQSERPKQDGFALSTSNLIGLNIYMSVYL